jgi:anti-sigma B factor antagonist
MKGHTYVGDDFALLFEDRSGDGCPVIVVTGELDLASVERFSQQLAEVVDLGPERVVIDLSATTFLDCRGARPIAEARRRLPAEHCQMVLRRPRPLARRVLEVMGLAGTCVIED